ncbi:MAG: hypothetical protein Q9201_000365 [Fulgogasparrea decipioides]
MLRWTRCSTGNRQCLPFVLSAHKLISRAIRKRRAAQAALDGMQNVEICLYTKDVDEPSDRGMPAKPKPVEEAADTGQPEKADVFNKTTKGSQSLSSLIDTEMDDPSPKTLKRSRFLELAATAAAISSSRTSRAGLTLPALPAKGKEKEVINEPGKAQKALQDNDDRALPLDL